MSRHPPEQKNPFIYGNPILSNKFVGRKRELKRIFDDISSGHSIAVVGSTKIGKSSFLRKLEDVETGKYYLGNNLEALYIIMIDLSPIPATYKPSDFWSTIFNKLTKKYDVHVEIKALLQKVASANYDLTSLKELLGSLKSSNKKLVLLLDSAHMLLDHHNFQDPLFYITLRSLGGNEGLVIVTSSYLSVTQMQDYVETITRKSLIGSPFFNTYNEIRLPPFEKDDINELLLKANSKFSNIDLKFIKDSAGNHPFMLQGMASALWRVSDKDPHRLLFNNFYRETSHVFKGFWQRLNENERIVTIILLKSSVLEEENNNTLLSYINSKKVALIKYLKDLSNYGLVIKNNKSNELDTTHSSSFSGKEWMIGSRIFAKYLDEQLSTRALDALLEPDMAFREKGAIPFLTLDQLRPIIQQNSVHSHLEPDRPNDDRSTQPERLNLYNCIKKYFNMSELEALCFNLYIVYEDIKGENFSDKIRELVLYCERLNRIEDLTKYVHKERPDSC